MARYSNVTTNFSGGLITDNLSGRTDIDRVANSCRKLTNFLPSLQGPTSFRQGFQLQYVDQDESGTQFRQVHLTVGKDESYRLVFTDKKLRVFNTDGTIAFEWNNIPYTAAQLNDLRFSSETSVVYICHPNHRPRKFEVISGVSYFYELDTFIEPVLQEEETQTRIDVIQGEEVAKVESDQADFQAIYYDYISTANGKLVNTFSKSWYVEYNVNDIWLLGKVVDTAEHYPEVTGPTEKVVYVDQVDFVTDITDSGALFYLLDNKITANDSNEEVALENEDVPDGEVHLRVDTDVFDASQIGSYIRVAPENSSDNVIIDSSSQMTRWVRIGEYLGNEAHPVDFARSTAWTGIAGDGSSNQNPIGFANSTGKTHAVNAAGFYESGSVYESYGPMSVDIQLPKFDYTSGAGVAYDSGIVRPTPGGNRTFSWTGGRFKNLSLYSAADIVGNLSTAQEFDVHKVSDAGDAVHSASLGGVAANLIQPAGQVNVVEIANDVTLKATTGIFTATTAPNRHLRGVMPSGSVYMKILERTSDTLVRARLKSPVPRNPSTGKFENSGRFQKFSLGAWYTNNFPSDVAGFERRRVFGGTPANPNYIFFSKLDDEDSFASTEDDGTVLDTNAISYPLSNVNSSVRWVIAAKDLIVGTTRGIFKLLINQYEAAVSPKTVRFELVDELNCNDEATMVGTSIFFTNNSQNQLLEYKYDGNIQRDNANDLSKFIYPTFVEDNIVRVAVEETPQPRIYCLTKSGVVYVLTYQRQEEYYAWSKLELSGATILDLGVVRQGYGSGLDQVYAIINRSGVVQHEVLSSTSKEATEPTVYLDSAETGLANPSDSNYNVASKTYTINLSNRFVFQDGLQVDVIFGGVYLGKFTITNGAVAVTVLIGDNERWVVGFKYDGALQPMYPTWDGSNKPAYGSDNVRVISSKAYVIDSVRYEVGVDGNTELITLPNFVSPAVKAPSDPSVYTTNIADSAGNNLVSSDSLNLKAFVNYTSVNILQSSYTGFDKEKPLRGSYFGVEKIIDIEQSEPYPLTIASLVTKTDLN